MILLLIISIHLILLKKLIFFPYTELFLYPYLVNSGLLPYKQIFDQHFPGLLFLPINFNNLGMTDPYTARMWLMAVVVCTHLLLYICAKNVLGNARKALLVNSIYLMWQPLFEGWVLWIDSFLPLFLLPAFYYCNRFIKEKKSFWLFLTGLFLGMAVVFKQVIVPLAIMLLVYLLWQKVNWRLCLYYIIGLAIPVLVMLGYLGYLGVIRDFWFWNITFNLTTYVKFGTKGLDLRGWVRVIGLFLPLFYVFKSAAENLKLRILLLFALSSLAVALDRPDFVHFQPALPFITIGAIWGIGEIWGKRYGKMFISAYVLLIVWWLGAFYRGHIGSKVFFYDYQTRQVAQRIKMYSSPSQEIFLFGPSPHLYQMTHTLPAGRIFVYQFPWFIKETEGRLLNVLLVDPPKLIVQDRTSSIDGQKLIDYAFGIDKFISENYQVFDKIDAIEFLRHK